MEREKGTDGVKVWGEIMTSEAEIEWTDSG